MKLAMFLETERDGLIEMGLTPYKAEMELSLKYAVSHTTIYKALHPDYRIKERRRHQRYYKRPEILMRQRNYRRLNLLPWYRKYRKLTRNLDKYLPELFGDYLTLTSDQISDKIYDGYQIRIRSPTVEKLLRKYKESGKLTGFEELGPGTYRRKPDL